MRDPMSIANHTVIKIDAVLDGSTVLIPPVPKVWVGALNPDVPAPDCDIGACTVIVRMVNVSVMGVLYFDPVPILVSAVNRVCDRRGR